MAPNPRRAAPQAGFTLVEALVAVALLAFVMLGTMPIFIRSISDVARNRTLMHINGGTQSLIDELTVRYGIDSADPLVARTGVSPNGVWQVYNTQGKPPAAGDPIAVTQLFTGAGAAGAADRTMQNVLVGQMQYKVETEAGTGRQLVTVELYYFPRSQSVRPVTGTAALTPATAKALKMTANRHISYLDQP